MKFSDISSPIIEASYDGNIGAMEMFKFYQVASVEDKKLLKQLIAADKRGLAWQLIQRVTGVKLKGKEFNKVDEGWKELAVAAGLGSMAAGFGGAAYDKYKASNPDVEKPAIQRAADGISSIPSAAELTARAANTSVTGSPYEQLLKNAAATIGIVGDELAQFMGQTAHESGNFKSMVEVGPASYFKMYEPRFQINKKTGRLILDPSTKKPKNFNRTAVILGNTDKGDGTKYKGRGFIQLTGRYNYTKAGKALGLDLVNNPELVEQPKIAADVALWFWKTRVVPRVDDFTDTALVTKPINSGLHQLDRREQKFQDFKAALQ